MAAIKNIKIGEVVYDIKATYDVDGASIKDNYATKTDVSNEIKKVVGTAPEALDTLEEIATALNEQTDAVDAINQVLTGKANQSTTYTKTEVDTLINGIDFTPYETVSGAATKYQPKGEYLTEHQDISGLATKTEVSTEVTRAKAAEKANADAIAAVKSGIKIENESLVINF